MGREKGLVLFEGKPLIEHVIGKLIPVVNSVIIISNQSIYNYLGYKVIADEIKDIGPAGGIYTCLKNSETTLNFITACDMPFITSESVKFMTEKIEDFDVCIPLSQGRLEPLFGIYSRNCLEIWEQNILKGNYKLQNIINQLKAFTIPTDTNPMFNQKLFSNINSVGELNQINNE